MYPNKTIEHYRFKIWQENKKCVKLHNRDPTKCFTLALNKFADLTTAEFVQLFTGFIPGNNNDIVVKRSNGNIFVPQENEHPTSVDWRQKGYVTPVQDQKKCGSCWAFSATGSLEGQHFKHTGNLIPLSEQNLIDCTSSEEYGNNSCKGGHMLNSFNYIKNKSIEADTSYPYEARDGMCRHNESEVVANCSGYFQIKCKNEVDLTKAIAEVGPISVAIDVTPKTFQLYDKGIYYEESCSQKKADLDHAVLAVGYGTKDGKDYYIVKNSWGTDWGGMNGYILMSRNRNNNCGIATDASFPIV